MARYFLEMAYSGAGFSGFQRQKNARTIQGEIDQALGILLKEPIRTTGSSRTDAGVHARQNFAHFDTSGTLPAHFIYSMNAILPHRIVVRSVFGVPDSAHARFDALSRTYKYSLYSSRDPFLQDYGYYFPFPLDIQALNEGAALLMELRDFASFSKRNSQARHTLCRIWMAEWLRMDNTLEFKVTADRFLRGMVRGLVGTLLRLGTGKISLPDFSAILESRDPARVDFAVPPQGLFLEAVSYPVFAAQNREPEGE